MSDPVREQVLMEALAEIPQSGFSESTLAAAAARAGVAKRELQDAFPKGAASLVEAFSDWADRRMTEIMATGEPEQRLRDRVASAVRNRIEVLAPHKETARRAAGFLVAPQHAALAARLMMRSVDAMWRAAGDTSSVAVPPAGTVVLRGRTTTSDRAWVTRGAPRRPTATCAR